jgi:hypothetical protein
LKVPKSIFLPKHQFQDPDTVFPQILQVLHMEEIHTWKFNWNQNLYIIIIFVLFWTTQKWTNYKHRKRVIEIFEPKSIRGLNLLFAGFFCQVTNGNKTVYDIPRFSKWKKSFKKVDCRWPVKIHRIKNIYCRLVYTQYYNYTFNITCKPPIWQIPNPNCNYNSVPASQLDHFGHIQKW